MFIKKSREISVIMDITDEDFSDEFSIFGVSIDNEDVYDKCEYVIGF